MVPGMTEREGRAVEMRRIEWLADATLGPARIGCAVARSTPHAESPANLPIGLWQRGLSSARVLGRRIRLLQPAPKVALPQRTPVAVR